MTTSWALGWDVAVNDFVAEILGDKVRRIARVTVVERPTASPSGSKLTTGTVIGNRFDFAVATLLPEIRGRNEFEPKLNLPPLRSFDDPQPNEAVFKVGFTTGFTRGRISSVEIKDYFNARGDIYWYESLFAVEGDDRPFSAPSDGGAVIVRERDGAALGLLLGGNGETTMAFPIRPVLEKLGATLLDIR